ncbi:MAG: L-seryl-tRNA selenium transferase [Acidobacteria bacterium]|nr:MAG: L-seryl-tRNA selenium transferase [Acidobacteriota bacterium]
MNPRRKDDSLADFYEKLGVKRVINAAGTLTRLGGAPMVDEVLEAMHAAAQWSVRMEELQEKAGAYLAEVTGAEAGYVTCGAAAGLQLAAAACLAGLDLRKMELLPDTSNIPNEIVTQRLHRNAYDHALRAAGAKLVEVGHIGNPARGYTDPWHIEAAIHKNTVAVHWVYMDVRGAVSLEDTVAVAHKHGVPVIVDAAAALPPAANLRRLVATGADLVSFSGGKVIGGPQASGLLVGRRNLIDSVALQHQDMDVLPLTWTMRHKFLDSGKLPGPPLQGIGRPLKVGKEQVAGLLTALRIYVAQDHAAMRNEQIRRIKVLQEGLAGVPNVKGELLGLEGEGYPLVRIVLDEKALGLTAFDLVNRLFDEDPAIAVGQEGVADGYVTVNPLSLDGDKPSLIVRRIRAILSS